MTAAQKLTEGEKPMGKHAVEFVLGKSDEGEVAIDLTDLIDTRALVYANSGGGKSWALRVLLEHAGQHVPCFVLDWEGEFASLREKLDMVLAGRNGEVPADPKTAGLLARRLLELGVSAVIDLSDLPLAEPGNPKASPRRRFVRHFLDSLMSAPRDLWRPLIVAVDEAHLLCPERSQGEAESTSAVIDLMSRGRKRGFCGVLATQRLAKLHKDATAECNNVFIGRAAQDVDQKRAADILGIQATERRTLKDLKPGQFYAFGPALSVRGTAIVQVGRVSTSHPKAGERHLFTAPKPSAAIAKIAAQFADLPKEAEEEARDLAGARARVAKLEVELKKAAALRPVPAPVQVVKTVTDPKLAAQVNQLRKVVDVAMKFIVKISAEGFLDAAGGKVDAAEIKKALEAASANLTRILDAKAESRTREITKMREEAGRVVAALKRLADEDVVVNVAVKKNEPFTVVPSSRPAPVPRPAGSTSGELAPAATRILHALARRPGGRLSVIRLATLTGYRPSGGGFRNLLGMLSSRGLLHRPAPGEVCLTNDGANEAGPVQAIEDPEDIRQMWKGKLAPAAWRVLERVIADHPDEVSVEQLAAETGYQPSGGGFRNILGHLGSNELLTRPRAGFVRASDELAG